MATVAARLAPVKAAPRVSRPARTEAEDARFDRMALEAAALDAMERGLEPSSVAHEPPPASDEPGFLGGLTRPERLAVLAALGTKGDIEAAWTARRAVLAVRPGSPSYGRGWGGLRVPAPTGRPAPRTNPNPHPDACEAQEWRGSQVGHHAD